MKVYYHCTVANGSLRWEFASLDLALVAAWSDIDLHHATPQCICDDKGQILLQGELLRRVAVRHLDH